MIFFFVFNRCGIYLFSYTQEPVKKRVSRQKKKRVCHDDDATPVPPEKKHRCSVCGEMLSSASNLSKHVRAVHLKEKPHVCAFCDRNFSQAGHLHAHEKAVHLKEKHHQCEFCDKMFSEAGSLRKHENAVHLR